MQELKPELPRIGLPMIAINLLVYVQAMVSVFCMGRLGSLELSGGALAIGFTNITGYSFLYGLATGMDPVCGQALGSKNWALIKRPLQRTTLMLLSACIPIALLWCNSQGIMLRLGQDTATTEVVAVYCFYALPDLLVNSLLQSLRVFMRSQGIGVPMLWCSLLAVMVHVPLNLLLVFIFHFGVQGIAIATWCTNFIQLLLLVAYLAYASKNTWVGWSVDCLKEWWPLLGLALASCFAVCLRMWWYEIITILAASLPSPQVTVATAAIVILTTSLLYSFPMAQGSFASSRVGNEHGARRPARARNLTVVILRLAVLVAVMSLTWPTISRNVMGPIFTQDQGVLSWIAAVPADIGLSGLVATGYGVLSGIARPAVDAKINLGSFECSWMEVRLLLMFKLKKN